MPGCPLLGVGVDHAYQTFCSTDKLSWSAAWGTREGTSLRELSENGNTGSWVTGQTVSLKLTGTIIKIKIKMNRGGFYHIVL